MSNFLINNNFYQATATPVTPIIAEVNYEPRAIFSITASNHLEASIWVTKDGQHLKSDLGTTKYTVRDAQGIAIGITESGITADVNGVYHITPVNATAIQDLTHYTVELEVSAEDQIRYGVVGITLGE